MRQIQLNNGITMPQQGFGTFQITDLAQCEQSVRDALRTGYRLIDTAAIYGNETAVGTALHKSHLPRNDVFLSSKVWLTKDGYTETMRSFEQTLTHLQTDYLDLYSLNMPLGDYYGSWRAMIELYRAGKIRALGVSNFQRDRLVDLIEAYGIVPAVDQVEFHPLSQQAALRDLLAKYRITPMAWAPFAEGRGDLFDHPVLTAVGTQYGKTPAQVILRWLRQIGAVSLSKSVHLARITENFAIDDFQLTPDDIAAITALDTKRPLILDISTCDAVYQMHRLPVVS